MNATPLPPELAASTPTGLPLLADRRMNDEHDELFRLVLAFQAAEPPGLVDAVIALRTHAALHFSLEDEDLRRSEDPNAQCHLDEHAAVLRSLDEVRAVLEQHGVPPSTKAALVQRLAVELRRWLPEHVREMDAGVATFRLQRRFGGSPVRVTRR